MDHHHNGSVCWLVFMISLVVARETTTSCIDSRPNRAFTRSGCGVTYRNLGTLDRFSGRNRTHHDRVSGGYNARPGDFPSFVTLKIFSNGGIAICSGVLIDTQWVLTAAHCLDARRIRSIKVAIGVSGFKHWHADGAEIHEGVISCTSPRYTSNHRRNPQYDMGVVKLKTPVRLSKNVQTACLPNEPIGDREAFAVGSGKIDDIGTLPRYAQVLPVKEALCLPADQHRSRICFKASRPEYKGDTCSGDSGGPIYTRIGGKDYVYGLTSYGQEECRKGYVGTSVNANVYEARDHIPEFLKSCNLGH